MTTTTTTEGRTVYEATLEIDYAVCIAELHAKLFGRVKKAISFVGVVGGTAAIYSLYSRDPTAAGVYGVVIALLSTFDLVYDPGGHAAAHQRDKQAFLALRSRLPKLSLARIDSELAKVRAGAAFCLRSLEQPALQSTLRSNGHSAKRIKLTNLERFVYWLT